MRITQLEYYVAAAETLNFTEAARRCYVAQPAVSQQIHRLEQELGFSLFARSPHGLALTEAGKVYYREAAEALTRLRVAHARAADVAGGRQGTLAVGACGPTQGSDLAIIRQFSRERPQVELEFRQVSTDSQDGQLARGDYDVVYTDANQMAGAAGVQMARRKWVGVCLMINKDNPLARRRGGITYAEALEQTLIMARPSSTSGGPGVFDGGSGRRIVADSQENVQLMVRLDMGATLVPQGVATSLSDDLVVVPAKGEWPSIELGWAYLEDNRNPALGSFLEFLERS